MRWRALSVACVIASLAAAPARATVVRAMSVDALTRQARDVVVAHVVESRSRWDSAHLRILTFVDLDVIESWKGERQPGERMQLVQLGGVADGIEMRVIGDAVFASGERTVLFLGGDRKSPYLVGLGQGKRAAAWDPARARWALREERPLNAAQGEDPAHAFVRTKTLSDPAHPFAWPNKCLAIELDAMSAPQMTRSLLVPAFEGAIAAWTAGDASCADLSLATSVAQGTSQVANDHVNRVYFVTGSEWCDVYDGHRVCRGPLTLALTTVSAVVATGKIVDADMQLNAVHQSWGDIAAGSKADQDLQNTLTHELGHMLGFDHACRTVDERADLRAKLEAKLDRTIDDDAFAAYDVDDAGRQVPLCDLADDARRAATMAPTAHPANTDLRSLTPMDVAGVCAVYGAAADRPCEAPPAHSGGCVIGDDRSTAGWALLAAGVALVARRRRRR